MQDYKPETIDKLIDIIPENPYDLCPCGCNRKWRFIIKEGKIEEHLNQICELIEKNLIPSENLVR